MKKRNAAIVISILATLSSCAPEQSEKNTIVRLPYFGEHDMEIVKDSVDVSHVDTIYFTVPGFVYLNQDSAMISHRDYRGHIYVTDYFFTTCPTICPIMTSQMVRLQTLVNKQLADAGVKFLSHTVDPEYDQPFRLKDYATQIGADFSNWNFVTGSKDELYDQARYGYFMTAFESDTAAGGFFHSDQMVLVDREGHIRGYYDGTSTSEVDKLFEDIKHLVNSYEPENNRK